MTSTRLTTTHLLGFTIAVLAFACVPYFLDGYKTFQLTMLLSYATALLGIVVLTGWCGQFSLGQGAFYGFGAYMAAILIDKASLHYLLAIPAAALASFFIGGLVSLPALRLKGIYLALTTFALAVAFPQLLKHPGLESITGGVLGLSVPLPQSPEIAGLTQDHWLFLVGLAATVIAFIVTAGLLRGPVGRAFVAISDNPTASVAMGISLQRYKVLAFAFSSMLTGIAGAVSALAVRYVAPDSFSMFLSVTLLVGAVVGGIRSIWGVAFGAIFMLYAPNLANHISESAPWAVYGAALILVVIFIPDGIASLFGRIARRSTAGPSGSRETITRNASVSS